MNDIDQKIQAALRGQTGGDALVAEPNIAEEVIVAFRGRNRWIMMLVFIFSLGFFLGAVWAGVRFYGAETVTAQLRWGGLSLLFMLMVSFIKVWVWLEMHTNRILRELKRVELLLVTQRPPTR
ncbi:MAG: hypothetical protein PSV13_11300 [Lacunisphaera sp.]|nr:hypothetical protein [Lacunisphaera sp.]